jgi:hypothetical protein
MVTNFNSVPPTPLSGHPIQSITSPTSQTFVSSHLPSPASANSQYQYQSSPNFDQGYFQGHEPPTPLSNTHRPDIKPVKLEPPIPTPPSTNYSEAGEFQTLQSAASGYPWDQSAATYDGSFGASPNNAPSWTDQQALFDQKPGISREFSGKHIPDIVFQICLAFFICSPLKHADQRLQEHPSTLHHGSNLIPLGSHAIKCHQVMF